MRILMIAHYFPPRLGAECICNGKLAAALVENDVDLTVVTVEFNSSLSIRDESPCWNNDMGRVIRLSYPPGANRIKLANYGSMLRMGKVSANWFARCAYNLGRRLLKEKNYDLILTKSPPIDSMVAGYYLSREFKTKWLVGINDPLPAFLYPRPYAAGKPQKARERLQFKEIGKILSAADLVMFPCLRLADYMENKLNLSLKDRLFIMPHIAWKNSNKAENNRRAEILHVGTLDASRRPDSFFRIFHDTLKDHPGLVNEGLKLVCVGPKDEALEIFTKENGMEDVIKIEGPVYYEQSLERMSQATALLLMEALLEEGIFLPSKFCDYALSGKPMLLYCPENGAVSDTVGGRDYPGFMGQDPAGIREILDKFFTRIEKANGLSDYAYPRPEEFEAKTVMKNLFSVIRKTF